MGEMQRSAEPAAELGKEIEGENSRKIVTHAPSHESFVDAVQENSTAAGRLTICTDIFARRPARAVPGQPPRRSLSGIPKSLTPIVSARRNARE